MLILEQTHFTHTAFDCFGLFVCGCCGQKETQLMDQGQQGRLFMCMACGHITRLDRFTRTTTIRQGHDPKFMEVRQAVLRARAIIDEAIKEYDPKLCFGMLSGGHDSLVMTHVLASHPRFRVLVMLPGNQATSREK